jgi:hypothetical protein
VESQCPGKTAHARQQGGNLVGKHKQCLFVVNDADRDFIPAPVR